MLGMILHEIAHGWVAWKVGDPTAKEHGRLTLNPVPHLDFMGTLFFLVTAFLSRASGIPFIFGWAKPVPINPRRFKNLRQGLLLVSVAGAVANLLLALAFTVLYKISLTYGKFHVIGSPVLLDICRVGIYINCTLAWFNLMPIPPLDGSKVLASLLPAPMASKYLGIERYGMIIVLLLFATNLLPKIMIPLVRGTVEVLATLVGFNI